MKLLLALAVLAGSVTAHASEWQTYKADITRNGTTETRVLYNFWSGEYPGPVIDVSAKAKGKTTVVQGYASLRDLSGKTNCEIKNGVYHPWSNTDKSARQYYTVAPLIEYKAEKDISIETMDEGQEKLAIKAGSLITEEVYYGEGMSGAVVVTDGVRKAITVSHDAFENVDGLKLMSKPASEDKYEQWIELKCKDGKKVFTGVKALMRTKGVQEGSMLGYGEVGPAGSKGAF
jgi:hypothetical protein